MARSKIQITHELHHAACLAIDGWPALMISRVARVSLITASGMVGAMEKVYARQGKKLPKCACGAKTGHRHWCSESKDFVRRPRKVRKPYHTWETRT